MSKISSEISNNFCPQTLFLYGTYQEDGVPDFGLFCWFSYTWDAGLGVMACIGGNKLTKDRIRATKMFSANLVSEELLPLADYYGNTEGYNKDKMHILPELMPGQVLPVPIIKQSPVSYELEVQQEVNLDDSTVFLCKIRNVLVEEALLDTSLSVAERLKLANPAITTTATYFNTSGTMLGAWGEPGKVYKK